MAQNIVQNAFRVVEGRAVTSSFKVAEYFGKKHSDVVRAVDDLIAKNQELQVLRNFARYSETVSLNDKGATRKVPAYWMDRKGFCLLAMGFTGAKALEFKCAFYDEFERMEAALRAESETLDSSQQRAIQREVAKRAQKRRAAYQALYGALKKRFDVPTYTRILRKDFEAAIELVKSLPLDDLKVEDLPAPTTADPTARAFADEVEIRYLKDQLADMRRKYEWLKRVCKEFNEQMSLFQCDLLTQKVVTAGGYITRP